MCSSDLAAWIARKRKKALAGGEDPLRSAVPTTSPARGEDESRRGLGFRERRRASHRSSPPDARAPATTRRPTASAAQRRAGRLRHRGDDLGAEGLAFQILIPEFLQVIRYNRVSINKEDTINFCGKQRGQKQSKIGGNGGVAIHWKIA